MASNSIVEELECRDSVINIPPEWPECCIYRVPKKLRKVNEEAYTPKLVSIGPFHDGKGELKDMEMHKRRYLEDFLKRTVRSRDELLKIIQDNKDEICRYYSENFDQKYRSKDQFANMILLDAIFIIELFIKYRDNDIKEAEEAERKRKEAEPKKTNCLPSLLPSLKEEKEAEERRKAEEKRTKCLRSLLPSLKEEEKEVEAEAATTIEGREAEEKKDYILRKPWLDVGIYYDLMLLENQLPFCVLEELYMFAFYNSSSHDLEKEDPFIMLSRNYFKGYDTQPLYIKIGKKVKHFTDLLRCFLCSPDQLKPTESLHQLHSATELDEAGLNFKRAAEHDITFLGSKCLKYFPCFNLSWLLSCLPCFRKCFPCLEGMERSLGVPPLEIIDSTEVLYRNLMALEQCHYPFDAYICNYVIVLDYLINTEKDVELLVDKNVIFNKIGSNKKVATLINNLCCGIVEVNSCYAVVGKEINEYYDNNWNRMMASMKSLYFRDFWRGTVTMVGLIVLGFTFWDFLEPYFAMRVDLKQVI